MPTDVRPANDSVLNVFAPLMVMPLPAALVKLTLLKICPPPFNIGDEPVKEIVEVPALKVKFAAVVIDIEKAVPPESVKVLPLSVTDRMLLLVV
jgi:hypothetical protein